MSLVDRTGARFEEVYRQSLADPEGFWSEAAGAIDWYKTWDVVLDRSRPPFYRWFSGALVNTCYNAVDRHVEQGRGDQLAVIWDSPVSGQSRTLTYRDLLTETARFAGALQLLGVERGDRVVIYMPNMPETLIGILACARIGAIHSVVFGGFAPYELAARLNDAKPKVVLAASCGIEPNRSVEYKPLLDAAIEMAEARPERCVILQRPQSAAPLIAPRDIDWRELADRATPVDCVPLAATDPLYILYTSGTTGTPKGIVRDNGGHLVALSWSMRHVYGVSPGEVYWAASDIGWAVGHSYMAYAPLIHGCTTVVYEGKPVGTPDAGAFWRVIAEHDVAVFFTAPTAFRAIKREDPNLRHLKHYDVSCLRALFLAGERADTDTVQWAERGLGIPVIDHWWQTETGWPMAANCLGIEHLPVKHGSPTRAVPGYDIRALDEHGDECEPNQIGAISVRLPLPPGTLPTLWNNDAGYERTYLSRFPGYYETADAGFIDEDGYVFIMGRTDDVMNVAGHRLSTGAMEEVLASHRDVAECAVIGVGDDLKGQVPLGLVVLKAGVAREESDIVAELIALVRERIGPVASFKQAAVVLRLPKTRSGKVLRGTMRRIADSEPWKVPPTIDDPVILDEIAVTLRRLGYCRSGS